MRKPLDQTLHRVIRRLGVAQHQASHREKCLPAIGSLLGIWGILLLNHYVLMAQAHVMIVASMGASAVLIFALPHGVMSQPWPVLAGHVFSALIGVTCQRYVPDPLLACALAVSLSIALMYYLHCLHPPGGATALMAVMGGPSIHGLGYGFVISPILTNVLCLLVIGYVFNRLTQGETVLN